MSHYSIGMSQAAVACCPGRGTIRTLLRRSALWVLSMKPRVYLEATIPSCLAAWVSRDLVMAGSPANDERVVGYTPRGFRVVRFTIRHR